MDAEAARQCRYLQDLCAGMAAVRKPIIAAAEGMAVSGTPPERPPAGYVECDTDF